MTAPPARLAARFGDTIGSHAPPMGSDFLKDIGVGILTGVAIGVIGAAVIFAGPVLLVGTSLAVAGAVVVGAAVGTGAGMTALLASRDARKERGEAAAAAAAKVEGHLGGVPCAKVIGPCSSDVWIEGRHVARALMDLGSHGPVPIRQGSAWVHVNGLPLAREGDSVTCGGELIVGAESTWVGGPKEGAGSDEESSLEWLARVAGYVSCAGFVVAIGAPILGAGIVAGSAAAATGGLMAGIGAAVSSMLPATVVAVAEWKAFAGVAGAAHHAIADHWGEDAAERYFDMPLLLLGGALGALGAGKAGAKLTREGASTPEPTPGERPVEVLPPEARPALEAPAPRLPQQLELVPDGKGGYTVREPAALPEGREAAEPARRASPEEAEPRALEADKDPVAAGPEEPQVTPPEEPVAEPSEDPAVVAEAQEKGAAFRELALRPDKAPKSPRGLAFSEALRRGDVDVRVVADNEQGTRSDQFCAPEEPGGKPFIEIVERDSNKQMLQSLYHEGNHYQQWLDLGKPPNEAFWRYYKKNWWWMETQAEVEARRAAGGRAVTPELVKAVKDAGGDFMYGYMRKVDAGDLPPPPPEYMKGLEVEPAEIPPIGFCATCTASGGAK